MGFINRCVINWYMKDRQPLAKLQMDWDEGLCDVFEGMVIMLTQNRNKEKGIVNGQVALIR